MASSKEVSTMIRHGIISDPSISLSPINKPTSNSENSISSSPSKPISFSPPPSFSRPTLFEMMSEEQLRESKQSKDNNYRRLQGKLSRVLSKNPNFIDSNDSSSNNLGGFGNGDVKLTISGRDGFKISMDVHRKVLAEKSRFFAEKLSDGNITHSVEICDCDDVEIYVETLVLMYSDDLKKKLMGEDVSTVLGLLKVSAAILFEAGILSCLEYLEAVPWSEDEEQKIISCLSQLQLHDSVSEDVLQRVSTEPSTSTHADDMFMKMLTGVLQAKDDKARKEMKSLISRLLREDVVDYSNYGPKIDVSKDTLYSLCQRCLSALILSLSEATCMDENKHDRSAIMREIAREADNIQWIVDILIDKKIGDEFVKLWADQKELAALHSKIPTMYRHEISKVTARLCIAIGRGHILVPKETRYCLLSTWLEHLYEDFRWMKSASRYVDKKVVEDGLGQTILTLPISQQQYILMNWFDRFLAKGDDCPNIQKAFEIWWRRAFIRQYTPDQDQHMQITVCDYTD
ncbi:BTB/POZ domain-containing protein At5g60050 [Amaranthus tricolor]|uniref:BTB/POZ domain-containing protein At5g60050 n=1 Tax=Amaranthus tricolor TaxID=29722 RepID=UPI0025896C08|nr:BTB/POZ domain-containing protein At5g60050 [Amaranthus tricolor]